MIQNKLRSFMIIFGAIILGLIFITPLQKSTFAQLTATPDITKLTGKEKIEISGNLEINAALKNFYKFTDKPLIEIFFIIM